MKIYIGSDHGGFELKQALVPFLIDLGHEVDDQGTDSSASVDYPNYAKKVGQAVVADKVSLGIVICGTGIGISLAANKVKGIRCALLSDVVSARLTREHNDTNMMAMGAGIVGNILAQQIVDTWLGTEFSGGERHQRRIDKMMALEK